MNLIESVEAKRIAEGLTNKQLTDRLGIYPESWYRIKRTKRFGKEFIIRAFCFLDEDKDQTCPETKQDSFLAPLPGGIRGFINRVRKLWQNSPEA